MIRKLGFSNEEAGCKEERYAAVVMATLEKLEEFEKASEIKERDASRIMALEEELRTANAKVKA